MWNLDELFNLSKTDVEAKECLSAINYFEFYFESGREPLSEIFTSKALFNNSDNNNPLDSNKKRYPLYPFCKSNNHAPLKCIVVANIDHGKMY